MTQQHPQRCDTCYNHVITGHGEDCKISDHTPTTAERLFVSKVGCASHSSATHTPAAPAEQCPAQSILDSAIKDLEREIKDQQWMIDNYKGHHKEIHENISKALGYALNLLRDAP